jgi:hypothetical protein
MVADLVVWVPVSVGVATGMATALLAAGAVIVVMVSGATLFASFAHLVRRSHTGI